jgi:16S rRNA processing protein RimM
VVAPHGIRGEVKCRVITDFPKERFKRGNTVVISGAPHTIQAARLQVNFVLLKLADVTDRDVAETLRDKDVVIRPEDAVVLPTGQFYWHQVIGLEVEDANSHAVLGRVNEILETGANDVYVVKTPGGREILVPAIKDVVKEIDLKRARMVIEPLPGMIPR